MCIEAYAGGLLDGEGCIYINTKHRPHQLQVIFYMTDREPLELLASEWGGPVKTSRRRTLKGSPIYSWTITGSYALGFLGAVEPWVFGKAAQVKLALRYPLYGKGLGPLPIGIQATRQELGAQLHEAKQ